MKKVTKILMIVVAVIVAIGVIFGISKAVGGFMPGKVVTEEKEKKVSVPDIRGMTEEKARKALTKKNIGYQSAGQVASDKYEKGEIAEQDPNQEKSKREFDGHCEDQQRTGRKNCQSTGCNRKI